MQSTLSGKVTLVTGANSGIGFETAQGLAERGATVVMLCRDEERGRTAREAIIEATGSDSIDLMLCDLSVRHQIRTFAERFQSTYDRLDVLVNNAGLYVHEYRTTRDGIEMTWAVNHLAPFLLTNLLLDLLRASAPARVVTVSSNAHQDATLDLDRTIDAGRYHGFAAYSKSKLANVLFTRELARRLEGTGVTANAVHPGMVSTNIWFRPGGWISVFMWPFSLFMRSAEKGAETVLYLATSPEMEGVSGRYFKDKKERAPSALAQDDHLARQLWLKSLEQVRERGGGGPA